MPACRWSSSPPTGRRGCAAPAPTRPPTRSGSSAPRPGFADVPPDAGHRADAAAALAPWLGPDGPVHLNLQLDEPLTPDAAGADGPRHADGRDDRDASRDRPEPAACRARARWTPARAPSWSPATTPARPRGCSPRRRGWPLLAEPTSGSRTGRERDPHLPAAARRPTLAGADRARRRAGHPTLCRPVTRLLSRADVEVVAVRRRDGWPDRPGPVDARCTTAVSAPDEPATPAWLEEWLTRDAALGGRLDALLAASPT